MSRELEDRVMAAHPLAPAHRMVLLMVARAVSEGQSEALVNRAALARSLDARPEVVGHALMAGEQLGVCRVLRTGRVVFRGEGLFPVETTPANGSKPAVVDAPPDPAGEAARRTTATIPQVLGEFARQWQAAYKQQYVFTPGKDHKLAKAIGSALSPEEVARRVTNYLKTQNSYYSERMHSFSVFVRDINEFGAPARESGRRQVPSVDETREYLRKLKGG
jgi:hypothetical protein